MSSSGPLSARSLQDLLNGLWRRWQHEDAEDMRRACANPHRAVRARGWCLHSTSTYGEGGYTYHATVTRYFGEPSKPASSPSLLGAILSAYLAACARERLAVLN